MLPCRAYPFESDDGPGNMGFDEALLDAVAADQGTAALRAYGWSVPTLSLGYFQSIGAAEAEPRWRGVPIVRRPTGGGALWHDREITYAVVVPASHPLSRRSADLYRAVHAAIAGLLRSSGLDVERRGEARPAGSAVDKPLLCFADRDDEDLVAGPAKLVGSAQRRRAGAVLQHGSLLLARSGLAPELPGAADLGPVDPDPAAWRDRLVTAIASALGLDPREVSPSAEERGRAGRRADQTYRDPRWTRKR